MKVREVVGFVDPELLALGISLVLTLFRAIEDVGYGEHGYNGDHFFTAAVFFSRDEEFG